MVKKEADMELEKFEKINNEKKEKIIKSAIKEFIEEGFTGASTNTIVKNAGISKGSLFNYFENKENLYIYLVKINMEKLLSNFKEKQKEIKSLKFFEGLKFFIYLNIDFFTKHPETFKFLAKALINSPPEIRENIQQAKRNIQAKVIEYLVENCPPNFFIEGINIEALKNMLGILLDVISNKYIEKYDGDIKLLISSTKKREKEIDEYLEILKYGILKREEK
jgi:TetR/AcrR family transcriptional regulator